MNINGNELRKGDVIQFEDGLYACLKAEHRTPGNKRAFMQAILRRVSDGIQKDKKFSAGEILEKVDLFEHQVQFLYADQHAFYFMDAQTYDQFEMGEDFIGEKKAFLSDGMQLSMTFHENVPISIKLPSSMEYEVTQADPGIKGATASAQYKSVTLSNGLVVKKVPPFVKSGDWIKVNTDTLEYVERVKK